MFIVAGLSPCSISYGFISLVSKIKIVKALNIFPIVKFHNKKWGEVVILLQAQEKKVQVKSKIASIFCVRPSESISFVPFVLTSLEANFFEKLSSEF